MSAQTCAVGPCQEPRADGSPYCNRHGPKSAGTGSWSRTADRAARLSDAKADGLRFNPGTLTCPHCGTAGNVDTSRGKRKRGVSGGKATGAILTGGWSLLATGLSRKQAVTECRCGACGMTWTVDS